MKHTLKVEDRHICNGIPHDAGNCPIALCIKEFLSRRDVLVTGIEILIGGDTHKLPANCAAFIAKFDRGGPVYPFSLTLDLSTPARREI